MNSNRVGQVAAIIFIAAMTVPLDLKIRAELEDVHPGAALRP
jgi:hypothetical protein